MREDDDLKVVTTIARRAAKKYHELDVNDFVAEGWLWLDRNAISIASAREEGDNKRVSRMLHDDLRKYLNKVGDRERAARILCDPDDFYYYSRAIIRYLLPYLFNGGQPPGEALSTLPKAKQVGSTVGGNHATWVADLSRAYGHLSVDDKRVVVAHYGLGWVLPDTDRKRCSRAIGRMQDFLGGPAPALDGEYTGARTVLSNTQAQHLTRATEQGSG